MSINCVHMLLGLLFNHIRNIYGEIRCVKFKIPSCEKKCNFIWFYLLYLFIHYLKRIIHQSFVSTAPTYGDNLGIAGVRCWTITFCFVPAVPGKRGGL